jgi:hypothetical protein
MPELRCKKPRNAGAKNAKTRTEAEASARNEMQRPGLLNVRRGKEDMEKERQRDRRRQNHTEPLCT